MNEEKQRLVINGNELYEIDLDCIKRKREGKTCGQEQKEKENFNKKRSKEE